MEDRRNGQIPSSLITSYITVPAESEASSAKPAVVQPQEEKKKRPLPAFLAQNERKLQAPKERKPKPTAAGPSSQTTVIHKTDFNSQPEQVTWEPMSQDQRSHIDDVVNKMAAMTLNSQQQSQQVNPEESYDDPSTVHQTGNDFQISRITATTKPELGDDTMKELTKKRGGCELPSFIDKKDLPRNKLPSLKDHSIRKIRQPLDDISFLQDAAKITEIVSGNGGAKPASQLLDLEDLNNCMLEISYTRSFSEEREPAQKRNAVVMPVYPKLPAKEAPGATKKTAEQQSESEENSKIDQSESKIIAGEESDWVDIEESKQKYFKDDSILVESSASMFHKRRGRRDEPKAEEAKMSKGMDKTTVIYVQVPSSDPDESTLMEEFTFKLDPESRGYYFTFGKTVLQIFDWRKYQRMLRHIKKGAIEKASSDAKKKTDGAVVTYERPEPWCKIGDFAEMQGVFDMDNFMDNQFVTKMLTVYKPRPTDRDGYVYILQRQSDVDRLKQGEITHILLHKIGMTYKEPRVRVKQQRDKNGEEYHIMAYFKTSFHKYLEYCCHRYFQDRRVVKCDSKDGGTEWFLVERQQLLPAIQKIRKALYYIYGDSLGWKPS